MADESGNTPNASGIPYAPSWEEVRQRFMALAPGLQKVRERGFMGALRGGGEGQQPVTLPGMVIPMRASAATPFDALVELGRGQATPEISGGFAEAIARTLRRMPAPLRRAYQRGPTVPVIEGVPRLNPFEAPRFPVEAEGGALRPGSLLPGSGMPMEGGAVAVNPVAGATPQQLVPTIAHEILGHNALMKPGFHPAAQRVLQRFAEKEFWTNPSIRGYTMRNTPEGMPAWQVPHVARTEGMAFPIENSLRTQNMSGVQVTPDEVFGAVDAYRRAARLQRAAERNPAWAETLGTKPPPETIASRLRTPEPSPIEQFLAP